MAFDAFLVFSGEGAGASKIEGETSDEEMSKEKAFEILEFNFDVENTLNIGSASGGAGAGKVQFNEFVVKKRTDKSSSVLFLNCCSGGHFNDVYLLLRKAGVEKAKTGGNYLKFQFKLVAVKKIGWSGSTGDDVCEEEVTFEYGAIKLQYWWQDSTGKLDGPKEAEWSRIKNKATFTV
ncbi:MAG: type VI secretion system tube protein Hcp [Proteobacteria bacterium]|nr:type VI secretion system tube protein Hcp [Pseudomonadota bacterium]MCH8997020.1 type VI secretion system tube protein Hcp [Pseudomonadota bacterium]